MHFKMSSAICLNLDQSRLLLSGNGLKTFLIVSSPEHEVSYCDHSPSVVRPSVVRLHFLVYTLASTNINQSAPNVVQMYMTIRSRMSSIMELIGPELSKVLFALEFGKIAENDFFYTLSSTNIYQSAPNLVKVYTTIRSWMSSIMELIGPELSRVVCP